MPKKVLLIEDDKDIRDSIVFALQQQNFEVIASEDARILKQLQEINPDLILLDNWLSDWKSDANGQQLSKEIKTNPATSHIPVVMLSAVSNIKEVTEQGQADGYLKKPFELDALLEIVKKFTA
ncbi:response regulator [Mucilaginibacter sp. Bleaf8]|uniref:response regulator n=1 Tax=Mucilaginibacter sp. Bleaf8 TaxID=2834430 RepID=UPI001BCE4D38|nr:response regulator [Mucilaginibacter sp. Bleaf8]MBS7563918.1 response regulator [Mucilaginibacter sp. Bleaf8]